MTFLLGVVLSLAGLYWLVRGFRLWSRSSATAWTRDDELGRYRWTPATTATDHEWADWVEMQRGGGGNDRRAANAANMMAEIQAELSEATRALLVSLEEEIADEQARVAERRPVRLGCRRARLHAAGRARRLRRSPPRDVALAPRSFAS